MKKVLLVATVQSHIAQFHKPLISLLKEKKYIVDVAAKDNLQQKNGLKIENVDNIFDINFSRSPINKNNITAYKELEKIVLKNNYDIIHCNTPMGSIITRLIKKNNKELKTKIIYTAHGFHFYKGAPLLNWIIYYPIEKYFSKYTNILITINDEDYNLAKNRFKNTNTFKLNGVGINLEDFTDIYSEDEKEEFREKIGIKKDDIVFVSIGELNKNKNQIEQIKAMEKIIRKYPKTKLIILGNGPLKEKYINEVQKRKLESNIRLLGYRREIRKILSASDFLISTSKREGLAVNVLEGLANGKIVIVSNNRGNIPAVEENITGFFVKTQEELTYMMEYSIKNKEKIYDRMFKNKKNKIKDYSTQVVKKQLEKIYNECMKESF